VQSKSGFAPAPASNDYFADQMGLVYTTTIPSSYPYTPAVTSAPPVISVTPKPKTNHTGLIVGLVVGIVALAVLTLLAVFLLFRRRRRRGASEGGTSYGDGSGRVMAWLVGTQPGKTPTVTTETTADRHFSVSQDPSSAHRPSVVHESGGGQVFEMAGEC
jgi:LPXTG-motif cell wall-anchored protein